MTGHDDLTGLLSRSGVEWWLEDGDGHGAVPSVLAAIDLEDFAGVNVEYGYENGDRVLRALANRLVDVAGADGVAARVGGDAFLVGRRGADVTPLELGRRVLSAVSESIDLGDREAIVCGNAGVVAAVAGEEAEAVVRRVEVALDRARRHGGQSVEVAEGSEESPFDAGLSTDLHHALERGELRVHYLPIVSLADCRVEGVEALVRWDRAGVVLDAGRFLALAERTGRIVPIGRWTIVAACNDVAEWNRTHPDRPPLQLSVNLSLRQLTEPDAVDQIRAALDRSGLDAKELCLEIREDSLSQLGVSVGPMLLGLKELGIRLSVDDFGTGASSLVALQRYQLDELKIDRSFVAQMDVDGDAASIVRGVVRLAESLGLDTVAAGVERPAQEQMLRGLGCRAAQGWLYARPAADLGAAIEAADRALRASSARKHVEHGELWESTPTPQVAASLVEAVFESSPIAMALIDDAGRHLAANPAAARLLALEVDELLDRTCWELVHPEDLQADLAGMDELRRGERPSYVVEERLLDADGEARWVEVTVSGVPGVAGSSTRLLRQMRSIEGERRSLEEAAALRSIIGASPEALIITDERGRCTHWNQAAQRLFGWSAAAMVGAPISRLVDADAQLRLARVLGAAAAGELVRWPDATWMSMDGTPCPVQVTVSPVVGASGAMIGLVVRAQDVAAERAAEQSLREVHDKLEARAEELAEANDRLGVYASTVSHDLMQPVAVLAGFLSLLDHGLVDLGAEHRTWLDGAIRGKDRLVQAIDALHRHAASAEILLGPVDLGALVTELVPGLLLELGHAQLEVDELPVVEGDAGLIVQVLANLVHNAGRYRHPDRPLVVEIHASREPASWLVTVSDTGKGIAPGELEAVFTPGTRGTAAAGTDGTGRGLATVRSLMSRMHGEAWAEQSATGARVCLRFRAVDS